MLQNVMMVCVGNICRSPIAEVYMQYLQPELNVFSSGLGALVGKSADPSSIELMKNKGIDLCNHKAQQIDSTLVSKADLILTMEWSHVEMIQSVFPESRGKVFLIGKWINNQEILDPYRKDFKAFESVSMQIQAGLNEWQKKLCS